MPGHFIDIASEGDEKWTKCIVLNRLPTCFVLSGYGGQASLYFKDLLPEKPIDLGDFLEVTFRPDAAIPTGNLVIDYRSCSPLCPRSVIIKPNHVKVDLHLTVRFKCFLDPGGPLGGLPLYSSKFVDVVDNRNQIPLPEAAGGGGEKPGENVHHVTAFIIREPNNERNYIWVVAKVLSDEQMSRLVSRGMSSRAPSLSSSAVSVARDCLNVSSATDMDRGRAYQTVPTVTNGSCGGSELGRWSSGTFADPGAVVDWTVASWTVDTRVRDENVSNPELLSEDPPLRALVVRRLPQMFIVSTASFDACLYFNKMVEGVSVAVGDSLDITTYTRKWDSSCHVVSTYRQREPFCESDVVNAAAGAFVQLTLNVTYNHDIVWIDRVVSCYSSDFVDIFDNKWLIGDKCNNGWWRIRAIHIRDPRDRHRHIWVMAEVIQEMCPSSIALVTPLEKTFKVSENVPPLEVSITEKARKRENEKKKKNKKEEADSEKEICSSKAPPAAEAAVCEHEETDSRMLTLIARAMGDRTVRDAILASNRDIYEEIIDRIVGVVVAQ